MVGRFEGQCGRLFIVCLEMSLIWGATGFPETVGIIIEGLN